MLLKLLAIAGLASFEMYAAIPTGFALGIPPLLICLASIIGGVGGVFISAFLGDRIKSFFLRFQKPKRDKPKTGLIYRIWNNYGVIGLGLLGTMTVGAPISVAVGISLNASFQKLVTWCCIGVVTRCIVFTLVGYYGFRMM